MSKSFVVRIDEAIHEHHAQMMGKDHLEYVRRKMCHSLAEHLISQCELFNSSHPIEPFKKYSIELTVNDRGSYENIVESAKHKARKEGYSAGKMDQPYGFEVDYDC